MINNFMAQFDAICIFTKAILGHIQLYLMPIKLRVNISSTYNTNKGATNASITNIGLEKLVKFC